MQEVVFDTKEQADSLQERDYQIYLNSIQNPIAKQQTTAWAVPMQRIDFKMGLWMLRGC